MTDKTTPERQPVADALPPLPASQAFSLTRSVYTADDMHAYASAALASRDAEIAKLRQGEPVAWEGTEGWEALAWHLCAEENGEEACNELVWEGGPIPEPWGDRWLKYEGEAKRMIALVGKHASPPPAPVQPEPVAWVPVAERMPKSGVTVLACYTNRSGNVRRIRAEWVAAKTIESDGDSEIGEYDEATDCCYDPEGWYEKIDNWGDYSSVVVNEGEVTHWMPLPAHPDASPPPAQPPQAEPLSEADIVRCAVESGCVGTVKMTFDSGPYEITRTSINADRFARSIERLITERMSAGGMK